MIYLNRPVPPYRLTKSQKREFIRIFIQSRKSVWRDPPIKQPLYAALKKMSHHKCAYCEGELTGGNYMEADHFYTKNLYPTSVVSWRNFLPSCKKCNSRAGKGTHDVRESPILNPSKLKPNQHLCFVRKAYVIEGIDPLGKETVRVLKLNDYERLLRTRRRTVDEMELALKDFKDEIWARESEIPTNPEFRAKIQRQIRGFFLKTMNVSQFSAVYATVLVHFESFLEVREKLQQYGVWTDCMQRQFEDANQVSFPMI